MGFFQNPAVYHINYHSIKNTLNKLFYIIQINGIFSKPCCISYNLSFYKNTLKKLFYII